MATDIIDLYERLKTVAGELLDKSSELAGYLENVYKGKSSDEVKKYSGSILISTEGFREVLEEAQSVSASDTNACKFASKLDGHLTVTRLSTEKMIDASKVDANATSLANEFTGKRALAQEYIKKIYSMTDVKPAAGTQATQNAAQVTLQTQPPLFWLADSGASKDTLALSTKLLLGPLSNSTDQETLADVTVAKLLKDWDKGVAFVKEIADEAEGSDDQSKISIAVSLLIFTRNQLRTLYNSLAITVQRLEQRALV